MFFLAVTLWSNEISDISFVGEAQGNGRTLSTLCRSLWLLEANNLQDIFAEVFKSMKGIREEN